MTKLTNEQLILLIKQNKWSEILSAFKDSKLSHLNEATKIALLDEALYQSNEEVVQAIYTDGAFINQEQINKALKKMVYAHPINWWGVRFLCSLDGINKPSQQVVNEIFSFIAQKACNSIVHLDPRAQTAYEQDTKLLAHLCSIKMISRPDDVTLQKAMLYAEKCGHTLLHDLFAKTLDLNAPIKSADLDKLLLEEKKEIKEEIQQDTKETKEDPLPNTKQTKEELQPDKTEVSNNVVDKPSEINTPLAAPVTATPITEVKPQFEFKSELEFDFAVLLLKLKKKGEYKGTPEQKKQAFDTAQSLCLLLEEEKAQFFKHQDYALFKTNCLGHIKQKRIVLDQHRSNDKMILNALAIVFSCGVYGLILLLDRWTDSKYTFFLTASDSALKVNNIEQVLKEPARKAQLV